MSIIQQRSIMIWIVNVEISYPSIFGIEILTLGRNLSSSYMTQPDNTCTGVQNQITKK